MLTYFLILSIVISLGSSSGAPSSTKIKGTPRVSSLHIWFWSFVVWNVSLIYRSDDTSLKSCFFSYTCGWRRVLIVRTRFDLTRFKHQRYKDPMLNRSVRPLLLPATSLPFSAPVSTTRACLETGEMTMLCRSLDTLHLPALPYSLPPLVPRTALEVHEQVPSRDRARLVAINSCMNHDLYRNRSTGTMRTPLVEVSPRQPIRGLANLHQDTKIEHSKRGLVEKVGPNSLSTCANKHTPTSAHEGKGSQNEL